MREIGTAARAASNHFAHDERVHIQAVEQRTDTWRLDRTPYFGKERTLAAGHRWQGPTPFRSNENEPIRDSGNDARRSPGRTRRRAPQPRWWPTTWSRTCSKKVDSASGVQCTLGRGRVRNPANRLRRREIVTPTSLRGGAFRPALRWNSERVAAKRGHHPQPHRGRALDAGLAMTTESPGSLLFHIVPRSASLMIGHFSTAKSQHVVNWFGVQFTWSYSLTKVLAPFTARVWLTICLCAALFL